MGASTTLNFLEYSEEQRLLWVHEQTNGIGADVTIECAGAPEAVTQAKIEVAQADKVGLTGAAEAVREREVRVAEDLAEEDATDGRDDAPVVRRRLDRARLAVDDGAHHQRSRHQ